MYLGEVTRNILLSLIDSAPHPILFAGKASKIMNTHYGFDTEYMSLIEAAWESEEEPSSDPSASGPKLVEKKLSNGNGSESKLKTIDDESLLDFEKPLTAETIKPITLHRLQKIRDVLVKNVGYEPEQVSLRDAAIVRWACAIVVQRAARLSGCAVATVVKQMGLEHRLQDELKQGGGWISVGVDGRYESSVSSPVIGLLTDGICSAVAQSDPTLSTIRGEAAALAEDAHRRGA